MLRKLFALGACLLMTSCATQSGMQAPNESPYQTGMRYMVGRGVPQNYTTAREWFEKAADDGNAYAESELGYMYVAGKGVKQDYAAGLQWYQKAANHGLASAQYNLGLMYQHGVGTPVNITEARKWYQQAALHGFTPARSALTHL